MAAEASIFGKRLEEILGLVVLAGLVQFGRPKEVKDAFYGQPAHAASSVTYCCSQPNKYPHY